MVNIHVENNHAEIGYKGEPIEIVEEVSAAVSGIYQGMFNMDPEEAEMFRIMMKIAMDDDSPVWDKKRNMTMFVVPDKK